MRGAEYTHVSICYLDLLEAMAVQLRFKPSERRYLPMVGKVLETLKSGETHIPGAKAEGQEYWEKYLSETLGLGGDGGA